MKGIATKKGRSELSKNFIHKLKRSTFGARLTGALLLASVLPVLLLIFTGLFFIDETTTKIMREQSENEKNQINMILNNRAYELERIGNSFARSSELYTALDLGNQDQVQVYTETILATLAEIDAAIVYDSSGTIIANQFREFVELERVINPVLLNRTLGSSLYGQELNFSYLANDGDALYFIAIVQIQNNDPDQRQATGGLVLMERLDQLFLQSLSKNFHYNVAFVSQNGDVSGTWQIKQFIKNNQITTTQLTEYKAITVAHTDTILIPVQKQVWAMISLAPITSVLAEITAMIQTVLVISVGVSIVLSFVLRYGITHSIMKLVKRLQKMRQQKQIQKLPLKGPIELQAVAQAFNDVIESSNTYQEQSVRDGLTNSFNQRYLQLYLDGLDYQQAKVTVLFGDIDFFKRINDSYGHAMGDRVICDVVHLFEDILGDEAIVSRYGGEEFVAILPYTDEASAKEQANRIRQAVMNLSYPEIETVITISIGISSSDDHASVKQVVKYADEAMYQAKQNGRNQCISYELDKKKFSQN